MPPITTIAKIISATTISQRAIARGLGVATEGRDKVIARRYARAAGESQPADKVMSIYK
jgi:hypothetical protein